MNIYSFIWCSFKRIIKSFKILKFLIILFFIPVQSHGIVIRNLSCNETKVPSILDRLKLEASAFLSSVEHKILDLKDDLIPTHEEFFGSSLTSFSQWCHLAPRFERSRDPIEQGAAKTVRSLFRSAIIETNKPRLSCEQADEFLSKKEDMFLQDLDITNIEPLAVFVNVKGMYLENNKIQNVTPLNRLKNLVIMNLDKNLIEDISSLRKLREIRILSLRNNTYQDLECPFMDPTICSFKEMQ